MKNIYKLLLLVVTGLLVVVGIVLFSGLFWIQSNHGLQWVQSRINAEIPGKITIESLHLSLLQPNLNLNGVVVKDPLGMVLAGFGHFSVGLDWQGLLQREIRLNHILLRDPWVDLVVDKDAGVNLVTALVPPAEEKKTEPAKTDSGELPFTVVVDSIQLINGRFTFLPADDAMHLEATGLNIFGDGDFKAQSAHLELNCMSVRFKTGDIHPESASINVKARLNGDTLRLSTFNVTSGRTNLHLSGSADHLFTKPVVDSVLTINSQLSELAKIFNLSGDYSGPAEVHLSLKGSVDNPDAELDLVVDKALLGGQPIDSGELAVDLKDRLVTIKTAAVKLADGKVTLAGTVDLREAFPAGFLTPPKDVNGITYALKLEHQIPDLNSWVQQFVDINGATDGEIRLTGKGVKPSDISARMTMQGTAKNVIASGMDQPVDANFDVLARMDSGNLSVSRLNFVTDGVELSGDGRFHLEDQSVGAKLVLKADDLSQALTIVGIPSIRGAIHATLDIDGTLGSPGSPSLAGSLTGNLSLSGKGLGINAVTIGDIDSKMRLKGGTIFLDRLHLDNKASAFDARGSIQLLNPDTLALHEDPLLDFTANSDHLDPGDFINSASGNFTFNAAVKGSLEKPVGRITLSGKEAELSGQSLVDTLSLDARFENQRIWLDQFLAIFAPGEQLEGGGSVGMDKTMDLYLKTSGISVASIEQLRDVFPGKGLLKLDATAKGTVDNPDVEGQLTFSDIIVNEQAMEDVNLSFSLHDMLAKIKGNLNFAVNADYDLNKGDFNGQLLFDQTETAGYFRVAGQPDLHGTLTGRVKAAGNIRDAANASVELDLEALHLLMKDVSLLQSDRIFIKMANQKLVIPQFELAVLSSGSLKVQGDAVPGGSLNMQFDGKIPLAVAGHFSDELADATGTIILKGELTGKIDAPQIDAHIDLENIGMTVPGLVQKLHDLRGTIVVSPDDIRLENLTGALDTGTFDVHGTIAHEKFTPTAMNLAIVAKALPLEVADTLSMLLNADIKITGNDRIAGATGEIVVLEGLYYKDVEINLLQAATDRKRVVAPASEPVVLPFFDTFNLDITVTNRQPIYVQNNMADLEISPDLKIDGGLDRPIVSGRATVKSGTITFQKKTFVVKKGVIDFINPYKTEAAIDIESETTIRNWTITLAVKGTPDNLDLKLSSVPTESDSDILSLILFGRTGQELVAGEGGSKRSKAQIMADMIADTFGEDIKKNTGVDILQLDTGDGGDDQGTTGTKVTVGKHLSDRMTVKYAVESKDGAVVQRAITEYKLLESILVNGFQDNQGIFGAELMFRLEFR